MSHPKHRVAGRCLFWRVAKERKGGGGGGGGGVRWLWREMAGNKGWGLKVHSF